MSLSSSKLWKVYETDLITTKHFKMISKERLTPELRIRDSAFQINYNISLHRIVEKGPEFCRDQIFTLANGKS